MDYLVSRSIISVLCILFFTYALVTKDLVKTVNCLVVDAGAEDKRLYHEFAASYGKYWGEDTSLKCFEGEHALLAFCVGIPGLVLISVGAPVYLAYFLNKNKARLNDRDFLNTYGFAYQVSKSKQSSEITNFSVEILFNNNTSGNRTNTFLIYFFLGPQSL